MHKPCSVVLHVLLHKSLSRDTQWNEPQQAVMCG
jgi:hypothetical protein